MNKAKKETFTYEYNKNKFWCGRGQRGNAYRLKNKKGFQVDITNYGGSLVNIITKDKNGNPVDVCLGYEDAKGYKNDIANFVAPALNVKYTVTKNNEIKIEYYANTDKATYVSLTNRCYFNLNGAGNGDILGHLMQIISDYFIYTEFPKSS